MPELPEVQTTVNGLNKFVKGLIIKDVWTDYYSEFHIGKPNIKNREFFKKFRAAIKNQKILGSRRRGKNVLIDISGNQTILVHMKMTGHLLYGKYKRNSKNQVLNSNQTQKSKLKVENLEWKATEKGPLRDDPYNRFVHVVFTLSNGRHLALSDLRKFAKITLIETKKLETDPVLKNLGPEPLEETFSAEKFIERLNLRPNSKIKQVLMDQTILAGIGNIYSDEMLWHAEIWPLERVKNIPAKKLRTMFKAMIKNLSRSLKIGGDSESDYRDVTGRPGNFQNETRVYGHKGERCSKPSCIGIIKRIKVGGRSTHFCPIHQKMYEV